jgi:hypothetical protein
MLLLVQYVYIQNDTKYSSRSPVIVLVRVPVIHGKHLLERYCALRGDLPVYAYTSLVVNKNATSAFTCIHLSLLTLN